MNGTSGTGAGQPKPVSHPNKQRLPRPDSERFAEEMRIIDATLDSPTRLYTEILTDETHSLEQRFAALYGLLHRLRREGRLTQYIELCKKYEAEFGDQPYFDTFRVVMHSASADTKRGYRQALGAARNAGGELPIYPGRAASTGGDRSKRIRTRTACRAT